MPITCHTIHAELSIYIEYSKKSYLLQMHIKNCEKRDMNKQRYNKLKLCRKSI